MSKHQEIQNISKRPSEKSVELYIEAAKLLFPAPDKQRIFTLGLIESLRNCSEQKITLNLLLSEYNQYDFLFPKITPILLPFFFLEGIKIIVSYVCGIDLSEIKIDNSPPIVYNLNIVLDFLANSKNSSNLEKNLYFSHFPPTSFSDADQKYQLDLKRLASQACEIAQNANTKEEIIIQINNRLEAYRHMFRSGSGTGFILGQYLLAAVAKSLKKFEENSAFESETFEVKDIKLCKENAFDLLTASVTETLFDGWLVGNVTLEVKIAFLEYMLIALCKLEKDTRAEVDQLLETIDKIKVLVISSSKINLFSSVKSKQPEKSNNSCLVME